MRNKSQRSLGTMVFREVKAVCEESEDVRNKSQQFSRRMALRTVELLFLRGSTQPPRREARGFTFNDRTSLLPYALVESIGQYHRSRSRTHCQKCGDSPVHHDRIVRFAEQRRCILLQNGETAARRRQRSYSIWAQNKLKADHPLSRGATTSFVFYLCAAYQRSSSSLRG